MNQNEEVPTNYQAPQMHPLSDQQLQEVSGGANMPWSYIVYLCINCRYDFIRSVVIDEKERCPKCGAPLKVLGYYYDEPSLE